MITGTTKLLGVIGHPIEHSLSPIMHNAAIAHLGADYAYVPFDIEPPDLATAIAGFAAIGVKGFNVTIPHKQAIMPLLSDISALAQAVGAVNTVWWQEGKWHGTNTDVTGFLAPLRAIEKDWSRTEVVVLGNGGASRAVVAGCAELGVAMVHVVGRDRHKLDQFHQSWQHSPLIVNLQTHEWDTLASLLPNAGLVVNTTPIAMYPKIDESPVPLDWMNTVQPGAIAYDLIYIPKPTLFLRHAAEQGATIIDGLEMLVQQGAAALEIWLDQIIPVDVMRQALIQQLQLPG